MNKPQPAYTLDQTEHHFQLADLCSVLVRPDAHNTPASHSYLRWKSITHLVNSYHLVPRCRLQIVTGSNPESSGTGLRIAVWLDGFSVWGSQPYSSVDSTLGAIPHRIIPARPDNNRWRYQSDQLHPNNGQPLYVQLVCQTEWYSGSQSFHFDLEPNSPQSVFACRLLPSFDLETLGSKSGHKVQVLSAELDQWNNSIQNPSICWDGNVFSLNPDVQDIHWPEDVDWPNSSSQLVCSSWSDLYRHSHDVFFKWQPYSYCTSKLTYRPIMTIIQLEFSCLFTQIKKYYPTF